jgi:hypothetical protein
MRERGHNIGTHLPLRKLRREKLPRAARGTHVAARVLESS